VDVNAAVREQLLRVPGLGYRNVAKILSIRRYHKLSLDDLRKLNVTVRSAKPFVVTTDHTPGRTLDRVDLPKAIPEVPRQMLLFESQVAAVRGEL